MRLLAAAVPAGQSPRRVAPAYHSRITRALHLALLLAVISQLGTSEFMARLARGASPSGLLALHEYVGLASVALVAAFWLWALVRRGETRIAWLFPWLSPTRILALLADLVRHLRVLARGRVPDLGGGELASAVHGLGLLTAAAMTLSGLVFYVSGGETRHLSLDVHKLFANLMWAYLIGHASIAILHQLLGADMLARMFSFRRADASSSRSITSGETLRRPRD